MSLEIDPIMCKHKYMFYIWTLLWQRWPSRAVRKGWLQEATHREEHLSRWAQLGFRIKGIASYALKPLNYGFFFKCQQSHTHKLYVEVSFATIPLKIWQCGWNWAEAQTDRVMRRLTSGVQEQGALCLAAVESSGTPLPPLPRIRMTEHESESFLERFQARMHKVLTDFLTTHEEVQ